MIDKANLRRHRKAIIICMFLFSVIINGGFFPIINFTPYNTIDLGVILRVMIIVMSFIFHEFIGSIEAIIFPKMSVLLLSIFNILLVLFSLIGRFFLEFGEISNMYNFTIPNVTAHVIILAFISTVVCLFKRRK